MLVHVGHFRNEQRDGYATSGSYNVALSDGEIQTVTYKVTYSGEAQYPEYKPAHYKPAPVYHAAPAPYHG